MSMIDYVPGALGMKLAVATISLVAATGAYYTWHHHVYQQGYQKAAGEAQVREQGIRTQAEQQLSLATSKALKQQQQIQSAYDTLASQRTQENVKHEATLNSLRADVRSGALRLSIAVARRPVPGSAQSTDSTTPAGTGAETRADILPGTADDILRIASESAGTVRAYNELVRLYNLARDACNQ